MKAPVLSLLAIILFASCSTSGKFQKTFDNTTNNTEKNIWELPELQNAHIGISILDTETGKYLYNYQGDKYFVPASNTKIFTLYAGMKYLKDSLPGINYTENADTMFIFPTADPSLLHPDFKKQPVIEKLQQTNKKLVLVDNNWKEEALGSGWSWDDYNDDYQSERNSFPVYGNLVKWMQSSQKNTQSELLDSIQTFVFSEPEVNWKVRFKEDTLNKIFFVKRKKDDNYFEVSQGRELFKEQFVPFVTNGVQSSLELLKDTVHKEITRVSQTVHEKSATIFSQPKDSLFKAMMYRSDNFFAEQILLMVSNEKLGYMNDAAIIDSMLKSDLKGLPQKPVWVDGSGLSRYNLFTPEDFVWILNKMKEEFGMEKLKLIFPGAARGTLRNYYIKDSGYIYAKTGTLSGQVALSGFLISKKNKLLIFSVLVNNHQGSATPIRRAVESFLSDVRRKN